MHCVRAGVANIVRGNPFIQVEHSGILVCTRLHCVPWLSPSPPHLPPRIAALRFVCLFTWGSTRYSGANPPLAHCVAYLCGGAVLRLCDSGRASASAYICANGKWRMEKQQMGTAWGEKGGRVNGKCGSEERRWLCYLNKSLHTLRLDAAINALLAFYTR